MAQIDYLIKQRFHDSFIPVEKFKIQFARMGEPSFNSNVLEVLSDLPNIYNAPGLMPSISSIAPNGAENFFHRLLEIKNRIYKSSFQLQFSLHSTENKQRDWLIPVKKWSLKQIADYGETFYQPGERKISLNFALARGMKADPDVLIKYFDTKKFLIKITPVNPTYQSNKNNISSQVTPELDTYKSIEELKNAGYQVLLSIGEWEENKIGSNCGQYLIKHLESKKKIKGAYTHTIQNFATSNI